MRFVAGNFQNKQQMFIQKSNSNTNTLNPLANVSDFVFHSDYQFFQQVEHIITTLTFPAHERRSIQTRGSKKGGSSTTFVPAAHATSMIIPTTTSLGNGFFVFANIHNGGAIVHGISVQESGDARRSLAFGKSAGNILITSAGYTHTSPLPSFTVTLEMTVYKIANTTGSDPSKLLRMQPNWVTFGRGKFDSNTPFLYKSNAPQAVTLTKSMPLRMELWLRPSDNTSGDAPLGTYQIRYSFNLLSHKYSSDNAPYWPDNQITTHRIAR